MRQDGESRSEAYSMGQEHFRVHRVKLGEAVCSTLQSVKAEPSDRRWKVNLDSTQQGGRRLLCPPHTRTHTHQMWERKRRASFIPSKPAESGGQRYSWRPKARGLAAGRQGNRRGRSLSLRHIFFKWICNLLLKGNLWPWWLLRL